MLRILPKLDVAVVEDVLVGVHVVEGLRGQHHAHIVARVKQRERLQEEVRVRHLQTHHIPQRSALASHPVVGLQAAACSLVMLC